MTVFTLFFIMEFLFLFVQHFALNKLFLHLESIDTKIIKQNTESSHHSVPYSLKLHKEVWKIFPDSLHPFNVPCIQKTNINCHTHPKLCWGRKGPGGEMEKSSNEKKKVMKMQSWGFEFQNRIRLIAIPFPGNPGCWTSNYLKMYIQQCGMQCSIFWLSQNGFVN